MLSPIVLVAQLGCDVPATPDAQEAREAAERELAREIYRERPSIWQLPSSARGTLPPTTSWKRNIGVPLSYQ